MTPQQIDAMKLALEALELVNIEFICGNGSHHKKEDRHEWDEDCPITNRWRKAITALKEALAEHAMREVQRLGQEIEQEPVAWPCLIDSADFSENTITLAMQCEDYKVSAGTHWLSTTPPKENT